MNNSAQWVHISEATPPDDTLVNFECNFGMFFHGKMIGGKVKHCGVDITADIVAWARIPLPYAVNVCNGLSSGVETA